jgi:double-stranded uracil-DNA glycosylase
LTPLHDVAQTGTHPPVLDDVLVSGLKVVFCGTAPGRASAMQRAYYAYPQNKFWRVLAEVGLTPRQLRPDEYPELPSYGLGLTDIAKHAFGMDKDLPVGSLGAEAVLALRERIKACRPAILAFTSLTGGSRFLARKVRAGPQPETLGCTAIWILPSPSPTANWAWDAHPWYDLARAVAE